MDASSPSPTLPEAPRAAGSPGLPWGRRRRRRSRWFVTSPRRSRPVAVLGSAVFLVMAPGTIAGYVPWTMTRWRTQPALLGSAPLRLVGVVLIAIGLLGLLDSFRRFAVEGF